MELFKTVDPHFELVASAPSHAPRLDRFNSSNLHRLQILQLSPFSCDDGLTVSENKLANCEIIVNNMVLIRSYITLEIVDSNPL